MDLWENRVNCTIHKFDDFLSGLEAVIIQTIESKLKLFQPDDEGEISDADSECEINDPEINDPEISDPENSDPKI